MSGEQLRWAMNVELSGAPLLVQYPDDTELPADWRWVTEEEAHRYQNPPEDP